MKVFLCPMRARSICAAVLAGHTVLGSLASDGAGQRAEGEAAQGQNIDDVVSEALSAANVPGAVVAVVLHDSIAFLRAYGRAHLEADGLPDPRALFRVGDATELINALAAAVLAAEGKLQLDAPLGGVVPDLPEALHDITLAQLLSHTGGLAYVPAAPGRGGADDLGAAARQLTYLDRFTEPGAIYSPSISGASLVGYALERAGGAPYAEVIRTALFRPLGMETATLDFNIAMPLMAIGYVRSAPDQPIDRVAPEPDSTLVIPRRGLFASVYDLARLSAALLNDGKVGGQQLLPAGAVASVLAPRAANPGSSDDQIALGTRLTRWEGQRAIRLTGGGGGHGFMMRLLPDQRVGVIVLTNLSGATLGAVHEFVFRRLLELPTPTAPTVRAQSSSVPAYDDPRALSGKYSNGGEEIELLIAGEQLRLRSGNLTLDVTEENGIFTARIADGRPALFFRIVHDAAGRAYLWANGRALARRADS